jgi:hypothetical protein
MSRISPWDYSLAWGRMHAILPYLKFTNTHRFCFYKYKDSGHVNKEYVDTHMSNNHIIPANINIKRALRTAHKGDLVEMDGFLIDVKQRIQGGSTYFWKTSLSRSDTGNGACEVLYVKRLRINDRLYE